MELEKILKICREYGVFDFKSADYELKIAVANQSIPVFDAPLKSEIGTEANPTEDQFLFMSSGEDVFASSETQPPTI